MCKKSLLLLFLLPFQLVFAQTSLLTDFPEGYTPKEVGGTVVRRCADGAFARRGIRALPAGGGGVRHRRRADLRRGAACGRPILPHARAPRLRG